jgi:hypothetical protein
MPRKVPSGGPLKFNRTIYRIDEERNNSCLRELSRVVTIGVEENVCSERSNDTIPASRTSPEYFHGHLMMSLETFE